MSGCAPSRLCTVPGTMPPEPAAEPSEGYDKSFTRMCSISGLWSSCAAPAEAETPSAGYPPGAVRIISDESSAKRSPPPPSSPSPPVRFNQSGPRLRAQCGVPDAVRRCAGVRAGARGCFTTRSIGRQSWHAAHRCGLATAGAAARVAARRGIASAGGCAGRGRAGVACIACARQSDARCVCAAHPRRARSPRARAPSRGPHTPSCLRRAAQPPRRRAARARPPLSAQTSETW
jgi:hypothetical protein